MKRILAVILSVLMLSMTLVACTEPPPPGAPAPAPAAPEPAAPAAPDEAPAAPAAPSGGTYRIAMLPKFKGENYFDGCYAGAQAAADHFGIELIYDGPSQAESTNAKQVEILNGFIAAGVDALIVSPTDAEGIAPTLRQAAEQGIVVTTFDADTMPDARAFLINQGTYDDIGQGLVLAAIPQLTDNGFGPNQPARLGIISGSGLDVNQNEWILAIQRFLKSDFPWITLDSDDSGYMGGDIWTPGSDETAAQNAAIEAIALSGDATDGSQINVMIGASSMSIPALGAAWNAVVGAKPNVVLTGLGTPLGLIDYILDDVNPLNTGVLWDVGDLGWLAVEATIALLDGNIDLGSAAGTTFPSTLGAKTFRNDPGHGGLELLLGPALIFDPGNVRNFNY